MIVQEKVPGGKMVCADVDIAQGRISRVKITGDFFLHPEDTLIKIEDALVGVSLDEVGAKVANCLEENKAQLIGVSPEDIERLVKRAAGG
jgi:lipoate-protein ligase A